MVGGLKTMKGSARTSTRSTPRDGGDRVYRRSLPTPVLGRAQGEVDVVRWKDIVEAMEERSTRIEDISDIVEAIVLKHA